MPDKVKGIYLHHYGVDRHLSAYSNGLFRQDILTAWAIEPLPYPNDGVLTPHQQEAVGHMPRVVVMTDAEVDDRCSMVHFLLYSNDMEVAAIIQSNSCYQRHGWSSEPWLAKQLDAYEQVYPNLKVHDPNYPTPDYLRSVVFIGDENPDHVQLDGSTTRIY